MNCFIFRFRLWVILWIRGAAAKVVRIFLGIFTGSDGAKIDNVDALFREMAFDRTGIFIITLDMLLLLLLQLLLATITYDPGKPEILTMIIFIHDLGTKENPIHDLNFRKLQRPQR